MFVLTVSTYVLTLVGSNFMFKLFAGSTHCALMIMNEVLSFCLS